MEHVAKIKFEHRGPVTGPELEEAAAKDVKEQIAKLPAKVRPNVTSNNPPRDPEIFRAQNDSQKWRGK